MRCGNVGEKEPIRRFVGDSGIWWFEASLSSGSGGRVIPKFLISVPKIKGFLSVF